MGLHSSLKASGTMKAKRNVLKRFERVDLMKKRGQWKPGDRVFVERYGGQLAPGYDGKIYRVMDQSAIGAIHKPKMVLS